MKEHGQPMLIGNVIRLHFCKTCPCIFPFHTNDDYWGGLLINLDLFPQFLSQQCVMTSKHITIVNDL